MLQGRAQPKSVRSIAFVATCSLTLFTHDTGEPVAVGGEREGTDKDHNIILWMDQRARLETEAINKTQHEYLKYFGGSISILMELPKILWLKHRMPEADFQRCKFYDLHDALTFMATGSQEFPCTEACTRDVISIGVDGTAKGWSREFLEAVQLGILAADDFKRVGGVCRVSRKVNYTLRASNDLSAWKSTSSWYLGWPSLSGSGS
jgi:ribulose kinase